MNRASEAIEPNWPFVAATRAVLLAFGLYTGWGDRWLLAVFVGLVLLSVPYGAWTGTLELNAHGLTRRTIFQGRELIPWPRIREIGIDEKRNWGHRIVVMDKFDPELKRPNRVVLSTGGSFMGFGKPKQHRDVAQLRRWWFECRGADWVPTGEATRLKIPADVNPYAPPPNDD